MSANDWLVSLTLGMVAGAIGQLVRAIVGLSKKPEFGDTREFVTSRLVFSVAVGATAGALVVMVGSLDITADSVSQQVIFGLVAAGYAGTDLIEGLAGRMIGKQGTSDQPASKPSAPKSGDAA